MPYSFVHQEVATNQQKQKNQMIMRIDIDVSIANENETHNNKLITFIAGNGATNMLEELILAQTYWFSVVLVSGGRQTQETQYLV